MGLARETGWIVAGPCSTASEEWQHRGAACMVSAAGTRGLLNFSHDLDSSTFNKNGKENWENTKKLSLDPPKES